MNHGYTYQAALAASEAVSWRVEDIIGGERRLDFARPFLPESLARVEALAFLPAEEKTLLNQIRGHAYLCLFGLVEEFILPFVLDHARPVLRGDDYRVRALLGFAAEEAKHIHLFKLFRQEFEAGFVAPCRVIGPPEAVAAEVLRHDPLAVSFAILHIEWMTQRHYLDSVRDDERLDPQFKSLLRNHWVEEAQHAKLDTLMTLALAEGRPLGRIQRAVEEYVEICDFIDQGLRRQVGFDLDAFERAAGRTLAAAEREEFRRVQLRANRWTYLGSGMTHERVLETLGSVSPAARCRVEKAARAFC